MNILEITNQKQQKVIHGTICAKISRGKATHGIYKTRNNLDDPNYDEKNEYKDTLIKYIKENNIKYLLDLHVMATFRKQDICIGTGLGKNIHRQEDVLNSIVEIFLDNKFKIVTIDDPFSAEYKHTVSATIAKKCSIPCFQIEINNRYVTNKFDEYDLDRVLKTMEEIVDFLIEETE